MKNFKRVMAVFMVACALAITAFGTVSFAEEIPGVPSINEINQMMKDGKVNWGETEPESAENFEWTDDMKVIWISDKGVYEIFKQDGELVFAELNKDD